MAAVRNVLVRINSLADVEEIIQEARQDTSVYREDLTAPELMQEELHDPEFDLSCAS